MPQVIRVRDVVRAGMHELGPDERALRVPYDLFKPGGPVVRTGARIVWEQDHASQSARYAEAALGDCNPGERVLLYLAPPAGDEEDEEQDEGEEWWLCEVESVDDVAGLS